MPTYQYECKHCGHHFEVFQSIVEPPVSECPQCGRKPRRIITGGAGFLLKGSGFYTTDYRSESYKKAAQRDAQAAKSAEVSKSDKSGSDSSSKK